QSVRSFAGHAVTLPPDGNNATGRPVARGIEQARRGGVGTPRGQQEIALPLVIPFGMGKLDIFAQRSPQRIVAKEDHLAQALLSFPKIISGRSDDVILTRLGWQQ